MLFRSSALALLALSVSTNAFVSSPAMARSSVLAMSELAASEPETAFDKSLKADIRKEVRGQLALIQGSIRDVFYPLRSP
jgi:hypothetical protein